MSATRQTYLTLHVTYHQETAIRNLYSSKGWLFKKKVLKVMFMDKENADEENAVVGSRDLDFRIDDTTDSDHHRMEKETDKHKTKETATNSDKADSAHVVLEKLKIETGTDGEETEKVEADNGNDDDDTDVNEDNNDDWIANLNDNYEDDNDGDEGEEEEEEYLPAKGTRTKGTKRKSSGLKLSIRKGKSGKKAKKPPPSETQTKIILSNIIPSTSTAQLDTERNDNVEKEGTDVQTSIVKTEAEEAPVEESNIDLGLDADADRTALEIELQETDDIDHYETVHKSLSPDEQFSKPSDVRESDGFSPSLGCYYCHDCGYTFQLQRWYKIHKWDGRCVYTCQVCSQQFTFRNITAYREHMKTHKFKALDMSFQDFVCHICGSSFKTTSGLRKHRICQHEREKLKFECPDCDERFIDQTHLNAHKIAKHGNESFTCDKCNKKFSRKLNLTRHQRYHCNYITMTMLKCSSSEATFKRQDSLDDHSVAVHSQRQKFTCNACGAEYKYRGSLSKHKARKH